MTQIGCGSFIVRQLSKELFRLLYDTTSTLLATTAQLDIHCTRNHTQHAHIEANIISQFEHRPFSHQLIFAHFAGPR